MVAALIKPVIEAGRIGPTNRAADQVVEHLTGLTPSSDATGEDLASMMPDFRHAFTRALFAPGVGR